MALRRDGFAAVVFDCDSTLTSIEGIDELAGDRAAEVAALTDAAMRGEVPLESVYGQRLEIIRPSRSQVEDLGRLYEERLVEDAAETIAALLWLGKDVRVISGGLLPPVAALAGSLGIARGAVAAVDLFFDERDEYAGFDTASPLARSGGKAEVIRRWALDRPSLMVGDGATDLEARPEVDAFAAYTGVAAREGVAAGADVVVATQSLAPVLALAASEADRARLGDSQWAALLERADALLHAPT